MPSWYGLGGGFIPYHNAQANNPYYGKKKIRYNWEQKKEAFKKRVEKRRAKK